MKLIFENTALLDPRAFLIMGLSAKDTDSPIGYFGTGLKYAIAVLLRNSCRITIQVANKTYHFRTIEIDFRGSKHHQCQYRRELSNSTGDWLDLPFTTDLGKNWELWMAYRELASNCRDESGTTRIVSSAHSHYNHGTTISCTGEDILQCHRDRDKYFISGTPLTTSPDADIYSKTCDSRFYKGVRVGSSFNSVFTYNVHSDCDLTEDRTLKYGFEFTQKCARAIATCTNPSIIQQVLEAPTNHFEHDFDYSCITPSEQFLDCLSDLRLKHAEKLRDSFKRILDKHRPTAIQHIDYEPTPLEQRKMDVILSMFATRGFEHIPIRYVKTETIGLHGFVPKGERCIYLTNYGLSRGIGEVAATYLEEYNHAVHNLIDFDRTYQDFLQTTIVNLIAELTNTVV